MLRVNYKPVNEQDDNQAENRFSYDSTKMQKTAVTTAEEEDDIPF